MEVIKRDFFIYFFLISLKTDYINEVLHETGEDDATSPNPNDDWDSGLTFTAKSTRKFFFVDFLFLIS